MITRTVRAKVFGARSYNTRMQQTGWRVAEVPIALARYLLGVFRPEADLRASLVPRS